MLLNENLNSEYKAAIKASGYKSVFLAEKLGMSKMQFNNIGYKKMVWGQWIDALDVAGYDVEVVIKPKTK